ncbi:MAP kinase kinase (MEK) [Xylographa vitiligo]|nr:MAP kinase kinase (MEK) [Xylographa vitiligo]
MSDFKTRTMKRKNVKGLALSAPSPKLAEPSAGDSQIPGAIGNSGANKETLQIGVEFQLDLQKDELIVLRELGAGNGGTVSKVMHPATKVVMARKVIHVEAKETVRKQIVRELHIMKDCNSLHIVTFYGAFLNDTGDVIMCMEYMDCGSLDRISKDFGPVRVDVLGKITVAILSGLNYLYDNHRIMHRDIKPSNVLVNTRGHIKLCDFGVSGELVNSIADTFVGTSTYMAPERIQGAKYSIKSDVWSVGLTVMELAIGRFPFDASETAAGGREAGPSGILDLLQQIVHEPPPKLPKSSAFPAILDEMIQSCLRNNQDERPTPRELYDHDNFIQAAKRTPVDIEAWAVEMMQRSNRKSHLTAPLSPATQALLRSEGPFSSGQSPSRDTTDSKTPTSGDIPIGTSSSSSTSYAPIAVSSAGSTSYNPEPVSRVVSAEINGSNGIFPGQSPMERPSFPPRTSSTSVLSHGRSRDHENSYIQPISMPIRPAPPPGGPLPMPPTGNARMYSRRTGAINPVYPNGEGQPL